MMGQKTHLKHVEFYSKNKFEKLVHLIGFIVRIYHDVRSSECQIPYMKLHCISWVGQSRQSQSHSYTCQLLCHMTLRQHFTVIGDQAIFHEHLRSVIVNTW